MSCSPNCAWRASVCALTTSSHRILLVAALRIALAPQGQLVFHLADRGQHGGPVLRRGRVELGIGRGLGRLATAAIEHRQRRQRTQRPVAVTRVEQGTATRGLATQQAAETELREPRGARHTDARIGSEHPALSGSDIRPSLQQAAGQIGRHRWQGWQTRVGDDEAGGRRATQFGDGMPQQFMAAVERIQIGLRAGHANACR
ncbi:hypothetical protein G6F68_013101 [Rhizopus microsporus]|nr:hypothetical protein G6F68_013101 [Rhizopus microsporus]